jgi:divalent metal cation (Fe/Co/Zn/Cd) transporter
MPNRLTCGTINLSVMHKTAPLKSTANRRLRQGLQLEYITLAWNVAGVIITSLAAIRAHSIALGGFGLDSLIEIGASLVVIGELTKRDDHEQSRALRLIGAGFYTIAAYILLQTTYILGRGIHPHVSTIGIIWTALTFLAMFALANGKRLIGTKLKNPVLLTEGKVTMVDAYLAGAVMIGLALNAGFGWWWADPAAGLLIVFYGIKEGRAAFREAAA